MRVGSLPFEIGDVVLIRAGGCGFIGDDVGKYAEVVGYGDFFGDGGIKVVPYDCVFETEKWGYEGISVVGLESFGENPLVLLNTKTVDQMMSVPPTDELYSGGSSDYYKVFVKHPTTLDEPYEAECADIIEALQLDFAEGNILKAIWRRSVARNKGIKKKGYDDGKYDAEKIKWFADIVAARYTIG